MRADITAVRGGRQQAHAEWYGAQTDRGAKVQDAFQPNLEPNQSFHGVFAESKNRVAPDLAGLFVETTVNASLARMNWTSTEVPMWEMDCQNFWRAGSAFEVRNVTKDEDKRFIDTFASSHNLSFSRRGNTVKFEAPDFARAAPTITTLSESQRQSRG